MQFPLFRLWCWLVRHAPDRSKRTHKWVDELAPCQRCGVMLVHRGPHDWRRYKG